MHEHTLLSRVDTMELSELKERAAKYSQDTPEKVGKKKKRDFLIEKDASELFSSWSKSFSKAPINLKNTLEKITEGKISAVGLADKSHNTFVCITSTHTYLIKLNPQGTNHHSTIYVTTSIRDYTYEWLYIVTSFNSKNGKVDISISDSEKSCSVLDKEGTSIVKNASSFVNRYIQVGEVVVTTTARNYPYSCCITYKYWNLPDEWKIREKIELAAMNSSYEAANQLYSSIFECGSKKIECGDRISFMKIEVFKFNQKVSSAIYKKGILDNIIFFDDDGAWRVTRETGWEFVSNEVRVRYVYGTDEIECTIRSKKDKIIETASSVNDKLSYIITTAKAYNSLFFND